MSNRNDSKERNTVFLLAIKLINIFYRSYTTVIYLHVIHFPHIGTKFSIYLSNIPKK